VRRVVVVEYGAKASVENSVAVVAFGL